MGVKASLVVADTILYGMETDTNIADLSDEFSHLYIHQNTQTWSDTSEPDYLGLKHRFCFTGALNRSYCAGRSAYICGAFSVTSVIYACDQSNIVTIKHYSQSHKHTR